MTAQPNNESFLQFEKHCSEGLIAVSAQQKAGSRLNEGLIPVPTPMSWASEPRAESYGLVSTTNSLPQAMPKVEVAAPSPSPAFLAAAEIYPLAVTPVAWTSMARIVSSGREAFHKP